MDCRHCAPSSIPLTGRIAVDRFELLKPSVQRHGDVALLIFNLLSYRKRPDGVEQVVARWNSTETYARINGESQSSPAIGPTSSPSSSRPPRRFRNATAEA